MFSYVPVKKKMLLFHLTYDKTLQMYKKNMK